MILKEKRKTNMILLIVYKIQERHTILMESIGYLDVEEYALQKAIKIRNYSLVYIFMGAVLELGFYSLYNTVLHPFSNILKNTDKLESKQYLF